MIYQTISTPDGLIFHMYGPAIGRRHDLTLLRLSGLPEVLPTALQIDGSQHYIFGDAAYMTRPWLRTAWVGPILSAEQLTYNRKMNALRTSVEWSYKDINQMWSSQNFSRLFKVLKSHVALLYNSTALPCNFKTCLGHDGQTQCFFHTTPPTLTRYIQCATQDNQ